MHSSGDDLGIEVVSPGDKLTGDYRVTETFVGAMFVTRSEAK